MKQRPTRMMPAKFLAFVILDSLTFNAAIPKYCFTRKKGANVNAKTDNGETPLLLASGRGGLDVVKLLVEKGSDINARDKNDRTVLMLPAWTGQAEVVKLLLEKGADVTGKDKTGRTALMWAGDHQESQIIELLRTHGSTE